MRSFPLALRLVVLAAGPVLAEDGGRVSIVPFAVPAYQPETDWMIGGAAAVVHRPPESSGLLDSQLLLLTAAASARGQFTVGLQPDVYLLEDRLNLWATVNAARFPDHFYGLGIHAPGDPEDYTPISFEVEASPKWRLARGLYLGPSVRYQHMRIVDTPPTGMLREGTVQGASGGTTVQLCLTGFWDTRDSRLNPAAGTLVRFNLRSARPGWGSSFAFDELRFDARRYFTLPWGTRHILAVQGVVDLRRGDPPFYDMGRLGGSEIGRGYFEGRFRERQYLAAQVEYRTPLFWRLGGVVFGSVGTVAHDLDGIDAVKPAGGAGLRFSPVKDIPVNLRVDFAYGEDLGMYLNLGEAF